MTMKIPAVLVLVLAVQLWSAAEAQVGGCLLEDRCGDVKVPYPFAIRAGCSLPGFGLTCDTTHNPPRLMLGSGTLEVLEISVANSTLRAIDTAGAVSVNFTTAGNGKWAGAGDGPYVVSEKMNQLIVTGCDIQVVLFGETSNVIIGGCSSVCPHGMWTVSLVSSKLANGTCFGIGCCETPIPIGLPSYGLHYTSLSSVKETLISRVPKAVRIAERGWFQKHAAELLHDGSSAADWEKLWMPVPVVLEWAVVVVPLGEPRDDGSRSSSCPTDPNRSACRSSNTKCTNITGMYRNGYVCQCEEGYDGNPYVPGGCQCTNTFLCRCPRGGCVDKSNLGLIIGIGVGSGVGVLTLALGTVVLTRMIKRRRERILRHKFFKQNRGHLLQQLLSQKADIAERMIIPLAELEKATNNFDESRELGGGGHGTVYKGILSDLHVVAIKKSKVSIQKEIDEFINEVAILSQINHRNVVKLFGCCLETEVPLLVYEFISNGTLYHRLHHAQGPTSSLPWEDRLRIATETARALAYLHSAVSFPVIHRDIKSHNILLDGSLTAKVADFGASRCIPAEQTSVRTAIQGTIGYLDPMYYYTGRLTEKSDVFSFGVLLIELLTRKKPYLYKSPVDESLVQHFTSLLNNQGNLVDILDPQVVEEGGGEEVREVAALAIACVKLEAEERPAMRQVEMKLERVRSSALQQQATPTHDVGAKRSKENHVSWSIPAATEGTSTRQESTTRQYSLEEENLLSSRYPR